MGADSRKLALTPSEKATLTMKERVNVVYVLTSPSTMNRAHLAPMIRVAK